MSDTVHSINTPSSAGGDGAVDTSVPALDGRLIPRAIRHGAIFGVLEELTPGFRFDLIAPHEPTALLAQIDERWGDAISHQFIDRGPADWRVRFSRR